MKKVVCVSLGAPRLDDEYEADLLGERFHVRRIGTGGDIARARSLVRDHDGAVDCIALSGMAVEFRVGGRIWRHRETLRIANAARSTPVVGGRGLKRIVDPHSIRQIAERDPQLLSDRNVLFLSGIANYDAASAVSDHTEKLSFADPVLHFGAPAVLHGVDSLHTYARLAMPLLVRRPYVSYFPRGRAGDGIQQSLLTRFVGQADVIVSDLRYLLHHCPRDLRGKVVITDSVDPEAEADLRDRGVSVLCCLTPQPLAGQRLDLPVLHAMIVAHGGKDPAAFDDDDYRRALDTLACPPRMAHPQGEKRVRNKFAYLYCPPGRFDLFRDPLVRFLRAMPDAVQRAVEKAAADLPITTWARVTGIRSPTGVEAEGFILFLPATAEQITERGRPWAEKRLQQAVTKAERLGARILGVGAFARTLSEATARVAPESAIPVTSGAAYVVSASMWAAKNAVVALGIGRDPIGRAVGTAIVVGGGDPTGAAAAALLALVFTRLVVIDKDADRALSIAEEIARENPHCQVESATSPDAYVGDADLVVTGLVPGWRGAVTIDVLKPGAVWADCARPSEASLLDADSRPDVLVVYAGELELPGPAELGPSLGPPPKVAFASFAEAVVLALEGRFECFSLGADVDLRRVKEIYKSGLRHDLRLASMRGPRGPIRESEIRLVRARADEKRTARG